MSAADGDGAEPTENTGEEPLLANRPTYLLDIPGDAVIKERLSHDASSSANGNFCE